MLISVNQQRLNNAIFKNGCKGKILFSIHHLLGKINLPLNFVNRNILFVKLKLF